MLLPHWKLLFNGVFPQIPTEEPNPWQLYPFFSPVCIPTDPHCGAWQLYPFFSPVCIPTDPRWGTRPLTAISFLFTCLYSHRSPLRNPTPDSYILPFHLFVFPQIPTEEPHPWQLYPFFSPVCIPTDPHWGTRPLTAISFLFTCLYSHRSPLRSLTAISFLFTCMYSHRSPLRNPTPDSYILPFHLFVFPQIPTEEPNPWQLYPSFSPVCIPTDPRWGTRPLTAISFLFTCLYSHRSPLRKPTPDSYILPFHLFVFPQIPAEEPDPWQLYPSFSPVCIPTDPRWGTWQLYPSFSPVCIPTDPRWGAWQLYPSFSLVCIPTDPHWRTQPLTAISFLFTCMYSHRSPLRNPTPDSYILPFHLFVFPQIPRWGAWQLYPSFSLVCIPSDPHWGNRPLTAISFLFTCLYSHRSPLRNPTPDSYILPFHLYVFPQIPAEEPDTYILPFHLFVFPQIPAEEPDSYILPFHLYVFPQIPTEEPNPWQLYPSFSPVCIPTDPRWGTRPLTAISFLFTCLYSHRSPAEEPDSYILPFHLYVFPQIPTEEPNPWQLYPSFSSVCIPTDPRWGTRPLTAISFLFTCLYSHRSPLRNPTPDSCILSFHLYVFPQIPTEEPNPWQLYSSFSSVCIPTDPRWGTRPLTAISFLFTCLYSHR